MTAIGLLVIIILVALVLWAATLFPIDPQIYSILRTVGIVIIVVSVVVWVLGILGIAIPINFR